LQKGEGKVATLEPIFQFSNRQKDRQTESMVIQYENGNNVSG